VACDQGPERAFVTKRCLRHEVVIGRPVHAGAIRSAVTAQETHGPIVTATAALVAA
jgi:hypothetical protein